MNVDLSTYRNREFNRGRAAPFEWLWRLTSAIIFQSSLFPFYSFKRWLLKLFGARVGKGVLIKPRVTITFPWKISIGDHSWIGEEVWLDSLDRIDIGANVCISQRAYLVTGSHNIKVPSFDLITRPIKVEDGVWIGASAIVAPGVTLGANSFLTLGSVVTENAPANSIWAGNPATQKGMRNIR